MLIHALQSIKSKLHSVLNISDRRAKIQDSDFVLGVILAVASAKKDSAPLTDLGRKKLWDLLKSDDPHRRLAHHTFKLNTRV